ncbi:MAG TPA: glycosyltransferase family 2 protein [Kofleriaceae bacterium]
MTPSYQQGRFLAATIESVLSQEGDFVIDYVICDGGSKDESVEVIKRYEAMLKAGTWPIRCGGITYRWLSEKDRGQTDAISKGFAMTTGSVLAWLNSDDTYMPGALQRVAAVFADPNVSVVYGKSHFTDEAGNIIGKYPTEPFDVDRLPVFNFISQPSTFFTKAALEAAGGLEVDLHFVMDFDLWIRLAKQFAFTYVPEFLSTWRLHDDSKTVSPASALANHKEMLDTVTKYFGWSPLNRVYSYTYQLLKAKLPMLRERELSLVALSVPFAAANYLRMNRGVRLADLKLVTRTNLRKLFMTPVEISKEY